MSRIDFTAPEPGDTVDAALLNDFYADTATTTGLLTRDNVREEGLRLAQFGGVPVEQIADPVTTETTALVGAQTWGNIPAPQTTGWTGSYNLKPGWMLRVRGSVETYTDAGDGGIPFENLFELRVGWIADGVAANDELSEVWFQADAVLPPFVSPSFPSGSNCLTTFGTLYNDTEDDIVLTAVRLGIQVAQNSVQLGSTSMTMTVFKGV